MTIVKSAFCADIYARAQNADFADFSHLIHSQVKFDDVDWKEISWTEGPEQFWQGLLPPSNITLSPYKELHHRLHNTQGDNEANQSA